MAYNAYWRAKGICAHIGNGILPQDVAVAERRGWHPTTPLKLVCEQKPGHGGRHGAFKYDGNFLYQWFDDPGVAEIV